MNDQNYWTTIHKKRMSRRRLLAGTAFGATGLAGLLIVGCGGDDGKSGGTEVSPASGTATPKNGGIWRYSTPTDMSSLDPFLAAGGTRLPASSVYSRLLRTRRGPGIAADSLKVEGDVAESWEVTPDGLTWTFKLRDNVRFHPPVDRLMTAEDVVFSMDRFAGKLPGYAGASNKATLTSFVDSWKATDTRTVVFTLKRPYAALPTALADPLTLLIFPKETGQAFDPTKTMVGSGPWIFQEYQAGSFFKVRRNPSWHFGPHVPYMDGVELYFITDPATVLNQFLGGNLDTIGVSGAGDLQQVVSTIKDVQVFMLEGSTSWGHVGFSLDDVGAPYLDPQVRQAVSMAIDRDGLIEASYSVSKAQALGYNISPRWPSFVPSGFSEYWVNPKEDPKLSPYFKYDPEGAKRLLAQVGYTDGFSAPFRWNSGFPGDWRTQAEIIFQMLGKIGLKLNSVVEEMNTYLRSTYIGKFDGMAYLTNSAHMDPGDYLFDVYTRGLPTNRGKVDDPEVEKKIGDIMSELDANRRKQLIRDFQTYIVDKMYYVPGTFGALRVTFVQPNVNNFVEYMNDVGGYGDRADMYPYLWKES